MITPQPALNTIVKVFVTAEAPILFGIFYHPQNANVSTFAELNIHIPGNHPDVDYSFILPIAHS